MAFIYKRCARLSLRRLASYSTAVAHESVPKDVPLVFETKETNPANHTLQHVGMYYNIPLSESMDCLFKQGGLPKPYRIISKAVNDTSIMVRKPTLEIIHYLKHADYNNPLLKIVVYGKKGLGKSMGAAHILHYGFKSDYLLVHVYDPVVWMRFALNVITPSTRAPGFYDLQALGAQWLSHFRCQNAALITKLNLTITQQHTWNVRESSQAGESLLNLVDFGINRSKYSCDVIDALFKEIKILSKSGRMRTLVVFNGYNHLFEPFTRLKNDEKKLITTDKLTMVQSFLDLTTADWHNSAAVLILNEMKLPVPSETFYPYHLLTKEGFDHIDPFIPVEYPLLTRKECYSMLAYLAHKKWLTNTEGNNELELLSGRRPYDLIKLVDPL